MSIMVPKKEPIFQIVCCYLSQNFLIPSFFSAPFIQVVRLPQDNKVLSFGPIFSPTACKKEHVLSNWIGHKMQMVHGQLLLYHCRSWQKKFNPRRKGSVDIRNMKAKEVHQYFKSPPSLPFLFRGTRGNCNGVISSIELLFHSIVRRNWKVVMCAAHLIRR